MLPRLHIVERVVERRLRHPGAARAIGRAGFREPDLHITEPAAGLAQNTRARDPAIVEHQLRDRVGGMGQHVELLADGKSRRAFLDQEEGNAAAARGVLLGPREQHDEVRPCPIGDINFAPVDDPIVTVLACEGLDRRRVGTRIRLGQREGVDDVAVGDAWQILLLLCLRPEGEQRSGQQGHRMGRGREPSGGNFLENDRAGQRVEAEPAVFRRNVEADIAVLRHQFQGFARELAAPRLHFKGDGKELIFSETARGFLQLALLVGQAVVAHIGSLLAGE